MLDGGALDERGLNAPPVVVLETAVGEAPQNPLEILLLVTERSGGEGNALADAAASQLKPADFFVPPPALEMTQADRRRRIVAVSAAFILHAGLCLGFVHFSYDGLRGADADLEIPIEVVIDSGSEAGAATDAKQTAAEPEPASTNTALADKIFQSEKPADVQRATAPPATYEPVQPPKPIESGLAQEAAMGPKERPQDASPVSPQLLQSTEPPAAIAAREQQSREREAVRRAAKVEKERLARERERAVERAQQHAQERERAQEIVEERERQKELAQRAAERARARDERRRAAERAEARREAQASLVASHGDGGGGVRRGSVGSGASSQQSRLGDSDGFDAASYRALIARAVRAAVGSRCSEGTGSRVVIALVIGRSGAIASASIASASGNAAFDAASVSAVRRSGPFPPPTGRSSVSVPVGVACR